MSLAFLLLGKTYVAFYSAGFAPEQETGVMGALERAGAGLAGSLLGSAAATEDALFTVDVSIRERHDRASDITSFPVEEGVDITDHVRTKPRTIVIDGVMTDTPSGLLALAVVPGLIDRFAGVPRSVESFQKLELMWNGKWLLDVVTSLTVYRNMVIERLQVPRDVRRGRSLRFSISMREVLLVSSLIGTADSAIDGAAGISDLGGQTLGPAF